MPDAMYSINPNLLDAGAMLYFHDIISAKQGGNVVSMRPNAIHKSDARANDKGHCQRRHWEIIDTELTVIV